MALVVKDRVKETTTTTGTGTLTLAGAAGGFQAFSAIGDGNTTYYAIVDAATGDWEVGLGTYTASGTTLSRDTILESSNTGAAVNLAAGTKSVFATYPAEKSVFTDDLPTAVSELTNDSGYITGNQTITLSGDVSGSGTTSISVTVADDSHNHIISNVDGLQAALDGKVDDSQVLTNVPAGAVFTDTTYSVGNGGLTEINFTSALNSKLSGIESGATADQTAAEILTAIKTVDGSGSGLDADTVDGIQASSFLQGNQTITLSGDATGSGTTAITVSLAANSVGASEIVDNSVGAAELNVTGNGTTSQFLRSDGDGTFTWATPTDTNTTYTASTGLTLTGTAFSVNYGTASGTACQGNDSRLSNSRTCNNSFDNAATARSNLGLGSLATLSAVGAAQITDNTVGAAELNVSGNGTTSQFLRSDGDGTFTWATPTDTNTTYSAGSGLDLSGTTFSVEPDLRDGITHVGLDTGDYIAWSNNAYQSFYVNGGERVRIEADGDLHADGDVIAYSTTISDERLKENIVGIDGALDKVSQLNGYTFTYKADGKISAGVIAQEVEKVLPEAVSEKELPLKADDGQEYKVVNYDALHGLLIEAIKELKAEIEVLKGAK